MNYNVLQRLILPKIENYLKTWLSDRLKTTYERYDKF